MLTDRPVRFAARTPRIALLALVLTMGAPVGAHEALAQSRNPIARMAGRVRARLQRTGSGRIAARAGTAPSTDETAVPHFPYLATARVDASYLDATDAQRASWDVTTRTNVMRTFGLKRASLRADFARAHHADYDVRVAREDQQDHVRDQHSTGRCWIFSTLTVLETEHFRRSGEAVDLSEAFVNYHAWSTRAGAVLDAAERDGRVTDLSDMGEGGWMFQAVDLVAQHGIVPNDVMPSTADSVDTGTVITVLRGALAEAQRELSQMPRGGAQNDAARHVVAMRYRTRIQHFLGQTLGSPPETFTVGAVSYTPMTYARERLQFDPGEYVTLGSSESKQLGTMQPTEGRHGLASNRYLNVSDDQLASVVRATLMSGRAAAFTAQVGADNPYIVPSSDTYPKSAHGVMSVAAFDYGGMAGIEPPDDVALDGSQLDGANHAMAFTGLRSDASHATGVGLWRVDNSWGAKVGDAGHFGMYPDFFARYVRHVMVSRHSLPKDIADALASAHPA